MEHHYSSFIRPLHADYFPNPDSLQPAHLPYTKLDFFFSTCNFFFPRVKRSFFVRLIISRMELIRKGKSFCKSKSNLTDVHRLMISLATRLTIPPRILFQTFVVYETRNQVSLSKHCKRARGHRYPVLLLLIIRKSALG